MEVDAQCCIHFELYQRADKTGNTDCHAWHAQMTAKGDVSC